MFLRYKSCLVVQLNRLAISIALIISTHSSFAGEYVATAAHILQISNTLANGSSFGVIVDTGPCAGQWIVFPEPDSGNIRQHQRAYANALMAMSLGLRVNIFNYVDGGCSRASLISIVSGENYVL